MMFGNRLVIEAELELQSDLHIGSGLIKKIERKNRDDEPETSELALVQRDHKKRPLIPSTSLKGALRAALDRIDAKASATLFGEISEHEQDKGQIGRLWIEPAIWQGVKAPDPEPGPELLAPPDHTQEDAFNRIRVALDRDRGAAAERLLFNEEVVRKGGRFAFRAVWFLGRKEEAIGQEIEQLLIAALAPLAHSLALGRDSRQGQGLIRLHADSLAASYRLIDRQTGILGEKKNRDLVNRLVEGIKQAPKTKGAGLRLHFALEADTPFISIGDPRLPAPGDGDDKKIVAPLMRDGKPLSWPSSLLGALRARCDWLVACAKLRAETAGKTCVGFDGATSPVTLRRAEDAAGLSSIERLFGITGWRGELSVERLEATLPAGRQTWTSVSIDRFTGGGRDRFLYSTETFAEPTFAVMLCLRPRVPGLDPAKADADRALIRLLIEDMKDNGIMLGHGAAKGFGWFKYAEVEAA